MNYNQQGPDLIQQYNGQPKVYSHDEISVWKTFLNKVLPWVTKRWELGNAYLEAKVAREISEANKLKAEASFLQIQAKKEMHKVIEIVCSQDESKAHDIEIISVSERQIEDEIKDLIGKIKRNYLKYGLKISFSVDYEEPPTTLDVAKVQSNPVRKAVC